MIDSPNSDIRVLIVDDSDFQRSFVRTILESAPGIEIVGEAENGAVAVEQAAELRPDVITMDIRMPVMNGLEATREIMVSTPTPIVIISTTVREEHEFAFSCLRNGALDFVPVTPEAGIVPEDLIEAVRMCSRIKVITHLRRRQVPAADAGASRASGYEIVGAAVSTGGPAALHDVLSRLPRDFRVPVVVVQHLPDGFTQSLAAWLDEGCDITVREAKDGEALDAGTVYVAPSGHHLIVNRQGRVELHDETIGNGSFKPSGDVMLMSLAEAYGARAIGVIMTGMGKDGVGGIEAIRRAGGLTMAQDEESSMIYGMNGVAVKTGLIDETSNLQCMADRLVELTGERDAEQ
ncbi:chemotaxis-specific protein-glutamate methyltransferase CheB [bacterium]|nr:chemotaxis-specific protein-glutamate methyltransferase CheB [bacterium]